ncbi:MAG: IS256 family transposase [Mariprofundus sp.]|nr:IS256 family transposase [Mariprofundus sp.]
MTPKVKDNAASDAVEVFMSNGMEGLSGAVEILINAAMYFERSHYLGVGPYERSEERVSQANGFKPKQLNTRLGSLQLQVPQTRDCQFYPQALDRGMRSERALKLALAEMYVQGVSTRKVAAITEKLCGLQVTSSQVSRAAAELDASLSEWRNRRLGAYQFVFLDARYEKIRQNGVMVDCAVLIAIGVTPDGKREVLGCSVELSEAEAHWRSFMRGLQERGLHGIKLIISDAHEGIKAVRKAVWPSVPWQRCQFHLQQNAQSYAPRHDMKRKIGNRIRGIFTAPDQSEAERLLKAFISDYEKSAPKLVDWAETALPEGFTVFAFDEHVRIRLRTSNVVERLNREIRRRTKVASMFPNEASCLRLVTAIVMETSDDWVAGDRCWLSMKKD